MIVLYEQMCHRLERIKIVLTCFFSQVLPRENFIAIHAHYGPVKTFFYLSPIEKLSSMIVD